MSLAGPVLSIQVPVSQHTSHILTRTQMATPVALDLDTSSCQLLCIPARRERANSEGDVHAVTQGLTLSPSPSVSNICLTSLTYLCPCSHLDFNVVSWAHVRKVGRTSGKSGAFPWPLAECCRSNQIAGIKHCGRGCHVPWRNVLFSRADVCSWD